MSKHGNEHYFEAPRILYPTRYTSKFDPKTKKKTYEMDNDDPYREIYKISPLTKLVYYGLKEAEARFTGRNNDPTKYEFEGVSDRRGWFYIGHEKLAFFCGVGESTVKKAKKELEAVGLVRTTRCYFLRDDGTRTTTWCTAYYIPAEDELRDMEIVKR